MSDSETSLLGVLGGMGPLATTAFMRRVIEKTPADTDQDHVPMVVYSDPTVPDRSAAILDDGESPVDHLRENVRELEASGVDSIAVPCNTFHYFYDDVASAVDVPILHMIRETARVLVEREVSTVGLLATRGTIQTGLYHDTFGARNIEVVEPDDSDAVMEAIYDIKAGQTEQPRETLGAAYDQLVADGVDAVVAGCTEVPLVFDDAEKLVDPMDVLAARSIAEIHGLARSPLPT